MFGSGLDYEPRPNRLQMILGEFPRQSNVDASRIRCRRVRGAAEGKGLRVEAQTIGGARVWNKACRVMRGTNEPTKG
jgi:hypothetical protein